MACSCAELRIRLQSSLCWPMRKRMPLDALYLYGNLGTFRGKAARPSWCPFCSARRMQKGTGDSSWSIRSIDTVAQSKKEGGGPDRMAGPIAVRVLEWAGGVAAGYLSRCPACPQVPSCTCPACPPCPGLAPCAPCPACPGCPGGPPRRRRRPGLHRGTAAPLPRRARRRGRRRPGCGACGPCWCSGWWAASCWPSWRAAPGRSPGAAPRGAS